MPSPGMLRRVTLVRTEVLEERSASIIRVTGIGGLETTLAVTSNRLTLWRNIKCIRTDVSEELSISSQRASVACYG
jgi:hypothetical protein